MTFPPQAGANFPGQYHGGATPYHGGQVPPAGPPGYGGFPPPPPRKKKTGLWVTLGIVVVALAAFAVTAFVVPGFLVEEESKSKRAAKPYTAEDTTVQEETAQDFGRRVKDALQAGQPDAVTPLLCPDATEELKTFAEGLREPQPLTHVSVNGGIAGEDEKKGITRAVVPLSGSAVGHSDVDGEVPTSLLFHKGADGWCWQDLRDIVSYLEDFRDALNAGDLDALHSMQCSGEQLGMLSDPLADAIALGEKWTMKDPSHDPGASNVDFVGGDATLDIGISSTSGEFCVMSGFLEK